MRIPRIAFLVVLFLCSRLSYTQPIEFQRITDLQGLPNNTVSSILKDSDGFMWFGTFNGLARYDGYSFTTFLNTPNDTQSISGNYARILYETNDKKLLVGTRFNGLNIFNRQSETFKRYTHKDDDTSSISSNFIIALHQDKKENLWVGTEGALDRFNSKTGVFTHYYPFNKVRNYICSITEDEDGNIWVYGLSNKLGKLNPVTNTFSYVQYSDNIGLSNEANFGGGMIYEGNGIFWIGNTLEGVCRLNTKTGAKEVFSVENHKLKSNSVLSIRKDSDGNIWIGTDGGGLSVYRHTTGSVETFTRSNDLSSLSSNAIYSVYESEPGLLWVGTFASGINVIKKRKNFLKFTTSGEASKVLNNKSVLSMAKAPGNKIWLGTDGGGLNLFDPKTYKFEYYTEENGKACANVVKSLFSDKDYNLWYGSFRKGLCYANPTTGSLRTITTTTKFTQGALYRNGIWSIYQDSKGLLWLGLFKAGLDLYDVKKDIVCRPELDTIAANKVALCSILKIVEDSKKRIWIGTQGVGLLCYDPSLNVCKQFIGTEGKEGTINSDDIRDIFEDSKRNLWFATGSGGLSKLKDYNKSLFENYTIQNGFPANRIVGILEDDKNNLWLSSDKGLICFNPNTNAAVSFDTEDGLQDNEFNDNSKLETSDGRMCFGGVEGFNMFHPNDIKLNNKIPPVVITDFKIFNHSLKPRTLYNDRTYIQKSILKTDEINLSYQDYVFSIEFSALNYVSPSKNRYAYRLEGFDNNWIYVNSDKRFATYTNLNPGKYVFRVIASNNDGVWNKEGASLTIIILPPWWQTWWFRTVAFTVVVLLGLLFIYLRTRSIRARNKFLEEEVKKQTAILKEVNKDLLNKNEILENKNIEIVNKTGKILEQQSEIIKQKEQLEKLNNTKDKFFSIIGHDLRNPVSALTMLTHSLKQELSHLEGPEKQLIENIEISSERIKTLALNLLEWARSQTGDIRADPTKIHVRKLIRENIELIFSQASQKHITIKSEVSSSYFITGDYNMIDTVVRNILSNSVKYTPNNGEVSIYTSYYNNEVTICFKDNGIGMSEELLAKLLKENYSFSTAGTNNEQGTGLGMLVIKEFSELNKGRLLVESEPGKGSTFCLSLPGEEEPDKEENSVDHNYLFEENTIDPGSFLRKDFYGRKILIVDDDEQLRSSLKFILSPIFEVHEAAHVNVAITLAEELLPDLIMSDIKMPDISGISFCNAIKTNRVTCHIPVILLTGQTSKKIQLEGLQAGADAYVVKPFDENILLTTINNIFTSQENIKLRFSSGTELLPSDFTKNKLDEELLSKMIKFVEANISSPDINGDALAKELAISKSVLYIKLKNLSGQTVNEFIRTIRLKNSTKLLLEGRLNITQISFEMGFNSPSYFTKSFTKHFGLSPKEYIAKQRGVSHNA